MVVLFHLNTFIASWPILEFFGFPVICITGYGEGGGGDCHSVCESDVSRVKGETKKNHIKIHVVDHDW